MGTHDYPPIERVLQCFTYRDGELFWNNRPLDHFASEQVWKIWNKRFAGKKAGWLGKVGRGKNKSVRWHITLDGRQYLRSVIVWSLINGRWPIDQVDHKNMDWTQDHSGNLRECTRSQQMANIGMRSNNTSGYKGVCWDKRRNRWTVRVSFGGKCVYQKYFDDDREGALAYDEMSVKHHGEFAVTNAMLGLL